MGETGPTGYTCASFPLTADTFGSYVYYGFSGWTASISNIRLGSNLGQYVEENNSIGFGYPEGPSGPKLLSNAINMGGVLFSYLSSSLTIQPSNKILLGNNNTLSYTGGDTGIANSIAIGSNVQGLKKNCIGIGQTIGSSTTSDSIGIGTLASIESTTGSFNMGSSAMSSNNLQSKNIIAIGNQTAKTLDARNASDTIAIGNETFKVCPGISSIGIGAYIQTNGVSTFNQYIGIGNYFDISGIGIDVNNPILIGYDSGYRMFSNSISIGITNFQNLHSNYPYINAIAIGKQISPNENCICIGNNAAVINQKKNAIAIGENAGRTGQGSNCIAFGKNAGYTGQGNNSIIFNATNSLLTTATGITGSFYVNPVRLNTVLTENALVYNLTTNEIAYNDTKTFVIDNPLDQNKYLVHSCLEGPESGVYYRGKGEISNNKFVTISLPEYAVEFTDFTIQVTPIYHPENNSKLLVSEVVDNKFNVYGTNSKFYWHVNGKRSNIEVEPTKDDCVIKGDGPYKWIF